MPKVRDPERSAAAKARKPPPNPWARIRELEADRSQAVQIASVERRRVADLERLVQQARDDSRAVNAASIRLHNTINTYRKLTAALRQLVTETRQPWWSRNGQRIRHLSNEVTTLSDIIAKQAAPAEQGQPAGSPNDANSLQNAALNPGFQQGAARAQQDAGRDIFRGPTKTPH